MELKESIAARRARQGVSKSTQNWLIDRATKRRTRRAESRRKNNERTRAGQQRALDKLKERAHSIELQERRRRQARAFL